MKQAPVPSQVHPTDLLLCLLGHFGSHSRWGGIGCFDHFAFDLCRNHVQCIQFGWLSWIKIRRLLVQSNKYTLIIHRPSFYLYIYGIPFYFDKMQLGTTSVNLLPFSILNKGHLWSMSFCVSMITTWGNTWGGHTCNGSEGGPNTGFKGSQ